MKARLSAVLLALAVTLACGSIVGGCTPNGLADRDILCDDNGKERKSVGGYIVQTLLTDADGEFAEGLSELLDRREGAG